jgi:hypothetical protein
MCVCGQLLRGERQRRHLVIPCPNCSRKVFVLPASPFDFADEQPPAPVTATWLRSWKLPLFAGAGSVVVLLGLYLVIILSFRKQPAASREQVVKADPEAARREMKSSLRAMDEGRFNAALARLNAVILERERHPRLLTPGEGLTLKHLQRQADLLSRLSPVSLEMIVEKAMLVRDADERSAQLDAYRGKSIVFDDKVRRDPSDPNGRWLKLDSYSVEVDGKKVRVALEDLDILRDLPLDDGPRMIFGARFADTRPESSGDDKHTGWVIHFITDSGVLFTEADTVEVASPTPLTPGLKEAMQRQKDWLIERRLLPPDSP